MVVFLENWSQVVQTMVAGCTNLLENWSQVVQTMVVKFRKLWITNVRYLL